MSFKELQAFFSDDLAGKDLTITSKIEECDNVPEKVDLIYKEHILGPIKCTEYQNFEDGPFHGTMYFRHKGQDYKFEYIYY